MQASKRTFAMRGSAACAAAAVLIGGTFAAGTASAAPTSEPIATASSTAAATSSPTPAATTNPEPAATAAATSTDASLPAGLAAAVERDLGMSVEEFNAQGVLATKAAEVQTKLAKADPAAVVLVDGDTIKVKTSVADVAKAAAGDAKVAVSDPTAAPSFAKIDAASVDALFADYVGEFGATALQSIMVNGNGEFVIRTGDAATTSPMATQRSFTQAAKPSTDDFAAKYGNVVVEPAQGPAGALAGDVVNGQGYIALDPATGKGELCSIGWNGFNKEGDPAVISAGHCSNDGSLPVAGLTNPLKDTAVTGGPSTEAEGTVLLGLLGFSQFGGPGNSPAIDPFSQNPGNIGTDVSVIDGINTELTQLPKVTDWTTPASLQDSGPQVAGVSDAILGTSICKSGRTTGWSCGTVSEVGAFLVGGKNYPKDPKNPKPGEDPKDVRAVRGFTSTDLNAAEGDSGGSIIAGTLAVGMISAGGGGLTYGVSLTDALKHTDGYSVKIFLNAPKITTTGQVFRSTDVKGTVAGAPAGTTVSITIDGTTTEATVGADGTWTAKAPNAFGTFAVKAQAKNGFSTSETTTGSIEVIKQTLAVPAITAPAQDGTVAAPVTSITGTGKAGATIELTGDVEGSVDVAKDGTWSFEVSTALEVGNHTITAKQTLKDWNDSKTATNKFNVVPAAPAITSPSNGQEFAFDQGPSVVSGSNIEGAAVSVTIDGKKHDAAVDGGKWSVKLDAKLGTGDYTVTAVQTVGDVQSLTASSDFSVLAAPAPPATQAPTQEPTQAPPTAPAPTTAPSDNDLANTGASSSLLVLGAAGGILLLGGAAFLLFRRRKSTN
ncbi:LPXTG cell wall anchor domain-containing protein [Arthrobacter sp. H35-D1]|uniref:LPXTG cell wall anchor domain-containing protein n=1 Tax=Arthrobacter sp. H35-D1 TaxID=3046202 RepID=UPI0024BA2836|nr:LPXTG cell wall anchor domain-containing protein [Arthrobacter sp. H35-D1]MDJ0311858.1 LPXTG cell wall anchor domain-containing protein [Arthrobacter sp. H35-D1]